MKTNKKDFKKCPICGRFMSRIGIISRIRLKVESGIERTHICIKETITYATGKSEHE